jgi:hypothetical protein
MGKLAARALLPSDDSTVTLSRRAPCKPGSYFTTRCRQCTAGSHCPDGQVRIFSRPLILWDTNLPPLPFPPRAESNCLWGRSLFFTRCNSVYALPVWHVLRQCVLFSLSFVFALHCASLTEIAEQRTQYVTGCETVAPGHHANAPIGATAQLACGKGTYSSGATDTCIICPAGFKCTSRVTEAPVQCEPGTYSNPGNDNDCTLCSKGTFSNVRFSYLSSLFSCLT